MRNLFARLLRREADGSKEDAKARLKFLLVHDQVDLTPAQMEAMKAESTGLPDGKHCARSVCQPLTPILIILGSVTAAPVRKQNFWNRCPSPMMTCLCC